MGRLHLDDLAFANRRYRRWRAYAQTKLSRSNSSGGRGSTRDRGGRARRCRGTEFGRDSGGLMRVLSARPLRWVPAPLVTTAAEGALPTLRAAVDPEARGGHLYGPAGVHGVKGRPERVEVSAAARDEVAGATLWERCEQLTGVRYPLP